MFPVWLEFIQMIWFGISHICCEVRKELTCQVQLQQVCAHLKIGYIEVIILFNTANAIVLENGIQSTLLFKSLGSGRFFFVLFLKKAFIWLKKNIIKIVILWNINTVLKYLFSIWIYLKCSLLLWWQSWISRSYYASPQCQMILQKSF